MQDFRKGSTALLVLHVLADEPMYGFQLVEALRARTGGVLDVLWPVALLGTGTALRRLSRRRSRSA